MEDILTNISFAGRLLCDSSVTSEIPQVGHDFSSYTCFESRHNSVLIQRLKKKKKRLGGKLFCFTTAFWIWTSLSVISVLQIGFGFSHGKVGQLSAEHVGGSLGSSDNDRLWRRSYFSVPTIGVHFSRWTVCTFATNPREAFVEQYTVHWGQWGTNLYQCTLDMQEHVDAL